MTIDEVIEKYKEITNPDTICLAHCDMFCDKCVQESEQLVEWLEELKAIKNGGISDDKKQSIINEDFEREVQDMINSSRGEKEMSKFKVLKKVVVLDLEGQYGQYHIENNTVTVADKVYKSIADVDNELKAEEDELRKKLIELRKSKEEIKELFNEYVSE